MIRFYYHAGSPQTRAKLTEAIRRDLADGREVLLLVPEQETVSVELRMLRELPASAQLTFEVSNFSRFANRVFRRLGGLSLRAASPAVSALLMWQTLREMASTLHQYGSAAAKDSALCDLMLATDAQCRTACIDPENLTSAIDKLSEKGDPLGGKLSDLKAILTAYRARLEKKRYDDSSTDLNRLKDKLETDEGKALLQNTCVYIDSFTDFTAQELGVIGAMMAAAPSVAITFPLANRNTESGLHLSSVVNSHRHLQQRVKGDVERLCEEAALPEAPLDYFSHHLFNMSARPYFQKRTADSPQSSDTWECPSDKAKREKGKGGLCPLDASVEKSTCPLREDEACPTLGYGKDFPISLTVCDSPFEEANAIATQIHRLVRTVPDCRYRDITVVVRDATAWNGILDDAFQREGIPYFISEKTDVTLRPLIKLINGALRIRLRGWRPEDVVSYLKTGLCGVSDEDVNLFEEYLNVWHPKGERAYTVQPFSKNPDGYKTELSPRGARILEAANRVREALIAPLQQFFKALGEAENATALCRAIYDFLNILDIRKKLAEQAKECFASKEYREAEELSRLYGITVEALEAVSDAIGDQKLSVNELSDALKLVFSRTDIGSIPTSIDQVTVGSASMLRTDHPRFVLIAGLNDGSFPAAVRDDGLLSEADRRQLLDFKIVFPSNSEKMVSDELLYLHRAVAAPREGLFLSYSKRGADGRKLSPSIAINRVHALLPGLSEQPFAGLAPLDRIYSKNGAIEAYTELPEAQKALLPEGLISLPFQNVNTVERHAAISPEVADQLFGNSKFNPSQLESFATCAFRYYCDSILCLRRESNGEMTAADTGTFIHHVLEHVMKAVSKDKTLFSTTDAAARSALVEDSCEAYRRDLIRAGGEFTPRTEALFGRLTDLARLIVSGLFSEFSDSKFAPAFFELSLSRLDEKKEDAATSAADEGADTPAEEGEDGSVTLKSGGSVPLGGKIDRVDYWQDNNGVIYVRVVDYKTGSKSFRLENVEKGFALQMPLYLMALCRDTEGKLWKDLGIENVKAVKPAAVTYLSSNISTESTDCKKEREQALRDAVDRLERSGLLLDDPTVKQAMSISGSTAILGSGKSNAKSLTALSEDGFKETFERLEKAIKGFTDEIKSGKADIEPHHAQGCNSPCDYCPYIAICRAAEERKE